MLNIGPPELLLIIVIALVVVGPQRLPDLGRTIGRGLREFRKVQDEVRDMVDTGMGDDFKQTTAELRKTAAESAWRHRRDLGVPQHAAQGPTARRRGRARRHHARRRRARCGAGPRGTAEP